MRWRSGEYSYDAPGPTSERSFMSAAMSAACSAFSAAAADFLLVAAAAVMSPGLPSIRGSHSSSIQLNLSRVGRKTHPKHPLLHPDTPYTPLKQTLNAPHILHKALMLSRKVDE
jgi:hypothetical protein